MYIYIYICVCVCAWQLKRSAGQGRAACLFDLTIPSIHETRPVSLDSAASRINRVQDYTWQFPCFRTLLVMSYDIERDVKTIIRTQGTTFTQECGASKRHFGLCTKHARAHPRRRRRRRRRGWDARFYPNTQAHRTVPHLLIPSHPKQREMSHP
ncbi:hypothetical protein EJ05DRAFT_150880 [Pseudovirgaria hyperparasitica]|uniref:Uncharacterized protein n=1 Tax=Pseudovirgaria hyperparasitica TaxID=470096 RepID=A0A6A6VVH1_9PEZI|nr:uncharacterized protein EJ05DRAFT_150880 [Pseudovirgaria hyperparasitica]KAF2754165.1 hypothetical protein EJ05DRAFT_150880 [Pseudovirgaria hyperparasitica]